MKNKTNTKNIKLKNVLFKTIQASTLHVSCNPLLIHQSSRLSSTQAKHSPGLLTALIPRAVAHQNSNTSKRSKSDLGNSVLLMRNLACPTGLFHSPLWNEVLIRNIRETRKIIVMVFSVTNYFLFQICIIISLLNYFIHDIFR